MDHSPQNRSNFTILGYIFFGQKKKLLVRILLYNFTILGYTSVIARALRMGPNIWKFNFKWVHKYYREYNSMYTMNFFGPSEENLAL